MSLTTRSRSRLGLAVATAALLAGTGALGASAQDAQLDVDEIDHSPNIEHLANLPDTGPFDEPGAFGTDLAFQDGKAFVGNYVGFTVYDIADPQDPSVISRVLCPGSQNDISVHGDLLFLSTDSSRSDDSCASTAQSAADPASWEGMKIFDISDLSNPRYVKSVETPCGSHTHTLVPGKNGKNVYIYVSSYGPRSTYPDCQPPHDSIAIIDVPVADPTAAELVAQPDLFAEDGGGYTNTSGCHDITAFPDKNIAAGACMGDGIILDIQNPVAPKVVERVRDTQNFAFWHSATFNQKARKVVFTDELGGGGGATCNTTVGPKRGANAIYDLSPQGQLSFQSYFKIPRHQGDTENCVAHNGSLIPVKNKDLMVQAWYQGGLSVWDFTDSKNPQEIAYFERGPLDDETLTLGGAWSAYYYNGHVFSSDIVKGFDVLKINDERVKGAEKVRMDELNVQTQPKYVGNGN
jgi:LVIVD repeat